MCIFSAASTQKNINLALQIIVSHLYMDFMVIVSQGDIGNTNKRDANSGVSAEKIPLLFLKFGHNFRAQNRVRGFNENVKISQLSSRQTNGDTIWGP